MLDLALTCSTLSTSETVRDNLCNFHTQAMFKLTLPVYNAQSHQIKVQGC